MKEICVNTLAETKELAERIASLLKTPALITLNGDLGAGKTTFTKALAKALGIKSTVTSPTFTILKSYKNGDLNLHHIDAYRLEGITQDLGFEEIFEEDNAVCVVEWFDFIEYALPKERLSIDIMIEEESRIFKIDAVGEKYNTILEVL